MGSSGIDLTAQGIKAVKPIKDGKVDDGMHEPCTFQRQEPGPGDIAFDVHYCGICFSDVHTATTEENMGVVTGHELAGIVTHVGEKVKKFKVGDKIGVGCMVDSCQSCEFCEIGDEQYCENEPTMTYGAEPKHGHAGSETTRGGYSTKMVVREEFAIKIPESMPLEKAGPIMCAGITVYDPMVHWKAGSEHVKNLGVVGGGGLGHMAVKLGKARGCNVTVFSTSPSKVDHLKSIGADRVVISTDEEDMKKAAKSQDLILNTISMEHDIMMYQATLRPNGVLVQLGLVPKPHEIPQVALLGMRSSIAGSLIGGIKNTQEVVDLCAERNISPDVKVVPCSDVTKIFKELAGKSSTVQRYVMDVKNTMAQYHESK